MGGSRLLQLPLDSAGVAQAPLSGWVPGLGAGDAGGRAEPTRHLAHLQRLSRGAWCPPHPVEQPAGPSAPAAGGAGPPASCPLCTHPSLLGTVSPFPLSPLPPHRPGPHPVPSFLHFIPPPTSKQAPRAPSVETAGPSPPSGLPTSGGRLAAGAEPSELAGDGQVASRRSLAGVGGPASPPSPPLLLLPAGQQGQPRIPLPGHLGDDGGSGVQVPLELGCSRGSRRVHGGDSVWRSA